MDVSTPNELNRFAEEVLEIMPLMVREFAKREDNALIRGKISCPQMVVLHHTAEHGEVTVSEIAKILSIEKSSASVLLERLVRQKMLKRRHDKKDRRVVWVGVTLKGRKVVSQIMGQKKESLKAIFGKVSRRERAQYLNVLQKVKSNLIKGVALCLLSGLLFSQDAHAFLWWGKKSSEKSERVETSFPDPQNSKKPLMLAKAYEMALKRSESVAITAEEIAQAQARFYRSLDYFLPTVNFEMTRFQQDVNDDNAGGGSSLNFGRQRTPEKKFVFSQPLFSGFKELAALQSSGADKKEQRMKWKRAKELLFADVVEAYYAALNSEKDLQVLVAIQELMSQRMKDLKERVDLGRSRESELKTTLTDIKVLESDLVDAKTKVRVAANLLEFYLGESLQPYVLVEDNGEVRDMVSQAVDPERRADVSAAEQAYLVAQKSVVAANADFFPKITLDGNYYTQRVGFQSGNDWDVTLKFDVPVFEVGQTLGDVKEAVSNREKARLTWEETKRMAQLEARNEREEFISSQQSEEALGDAKKASKENYEILQKEYASNLVNNLEVLDALRRYQDIERRYQTAHYTTKKNYWKLKLALGELREAEA